MSLPNPLSARKYRASLDLFLASALGLFVEMMFIRWVASELRVIAFYKNFALIAAYLGIGLGFAIYRKQSSIDWFKRFYLPLMAVLVLLVLVLGRTIISESILLNPANAQEFVWAGALLSDNPLLVTLLGIAFQAILLTLFVLITILFIPLGQLTASKFIAFQPLPGYTINVAGSLFGVLLYTFVSFMGWSPVVWFLIAGIVSIYFLTPVKGRLALVQVGAALLPVLLTLLWPTGSQQTVWSPYYRIDINPQRDSNVSSLLLGYELKVNQAWHQRLWNLDVNFVKQNYAADKSHFDSMVSEYDAPYAVAPALDRVLIVGAGTGNDVAGALRQGAKSVTAVEIDPEIIKIGKDLHPEQPYSNSRVQQVVTDARSFFNHDRGNYNLIVFGLLDSHTLFGTSSSVRLDNFVYTRESISEAKKLLAPGGLLALSFGVPPANEWVGLRLYRTLTDVFGHTPQVYSFMNDDVIFLIGQEPIAQPLINDPRITARPDYSYHAEIEAVTDDWPYLYLRERVIPTNYLVTLAGVVLFSMLLLRATLPTFRSVNLHFFFMGAAFFLLETKSVTEMALLFGSTWIVNAFVVSAILLMIVLANLLVERYKLTDPRPFYALLAATLLFNFLVPVSRYLSLDLGLRLGLASFAQALPLFFAGIIFAITFSKTKTIEMSLGSNMVGAVLGGIFEYSSLVLGIRGLYMLALGFYALSMWALKQKS